MKNKRTIIILSILILGIVVYLLFFKKRKPEDLKEGDISIVTDQKNIPTIFKCLRKIETNKNEDGIEVVKPDQFPLKYGDCGKVVETLQKRLSAKGKKIKPDGKFGKKTEQALNEIYAEKNLPLTGKYTYGQFSTNVI